MPAFLRLPARAARFKRHKTGEMNATERAYAELLDRRVAAGEIAGYWFEALKFRLADGCWYTADFVVQLADGSLEIHEAKAKWSNGRIGTDDGRVKLKVVAETFPFPVVIAAKSKAGWSFERIG
jgi:hypothetical protein